LCDLLRVTPGTIMARKRIRVSRRILFTWFMLTGFIFLFTPQNLTNKFQFAFVHIFRWPLSVGRNISLAAHTQQPRTDFVNRRQYNQLLNHLANLEEELRQKHQKLEKLSGLRNRFALEGAGFVIADVITATIDAQRCELIINRGKDDGLDKGQFVLADNSIIGTISDVDSRTAKVKLFTDPTSKIEIKIAELNIERIMQGNGNNSAKPKLIPTDKKVKIGDIVYARKKPGFLDVPRVIGRVAQCKEDDQSPFLWDITVRPVCDIDRLNDVAVVIMNPQKN